MLFAYLALCSLALAQGKSRPSGSEAFESAMNEFMLNSLALSPVSASAAGYHLHTDLASGHIRHLDGELDDFRPQAIAAQRAFYADWQQRLRKQFSVSSLTPEDAADWQLVDDQISLALLEFDKIQAYRHNPTNYVETLGNGLFLPLTQSYASKAVRVSDVLSRVKQIPRFLEQAKEQLIDADPIFIKVAVEENEGNVSVIQEDLKEQVGSDEALLAQYNQVAPQAISALADFSKWMQQELARRPNPRSWRLGNDLYREKFKYVMETSVTPEEMAASAEREVREVRTQMLELATPMHREMYPSHGDHADLKALERENRIIREVLDKIADDHVQRGQLLEQVKSDVAGITAFIREKKIVALSERENLKVIPTPEFMRGIFSVAGFRQAPPLEPASEAEYWVTPIAPGMSDAQAESKLREYNNWVLKWLTIHEALPGHYIQAEHANNIQPKTRRLLRSQFANGAYVEGWAEYIAQVMTDEGFQNRDPRYLLSMKKIRLRVLTNAILDVRMHTMNMSDDAAVDMMMNLAFQTRAEAEGKLQRAKLSSAQLPTYYIGLSEWLKLRKQYEARMGPGFSLMEFHNKALSEGALPVPVLGRLILPQ